ncbi:hypothetical protein BOX15_Mlig022381g1 [Macrostomum lignano]|nr:hypothetical protein BOX15_Mlig022381g1 [Macrostomum lignano]
MSQEICATQCIQKSTPHYNYKFFGLADAFRCFCGRFIMQAYRGRHPPFCNAPCFNGVGTETCGGEYAMAVYELVPVKKKI